MGMAYQSPEENESPGTQETIEERGDLGLEPMEPQSGALVLFNQKNLGLLLM